MAALDRGAVRSTIAMNQSDLDAIERRKEAFRAHAAALATYAIGDLFVAQNSVDRFLGTVDDGLSDLFYSVVSDIEDDIDSDERLIGEAA